MKNIEKFKELLAVQSVSYNQKQMTKYLKSEFRKIDGVTFHEKDENIFVTKGKGLMPCVVSHIDTVHAITSDLYPLQIGDNITGFNRKTLTQSGIGGDDKVGIWVCLEVLRNFDNVKVAFFSNEEVGCKGSYDTDLKFFEDCTFVLQCDRQGNKDFVNNACGVELSSKGFQDAIQETLKDFGYSFTDGGMTDVMALKENGLEISCANMSCGYYNPHRPNEYINIIDVENVKNLVFSLISQFGSIVFPHEYVPYRWNTKNDWLDKPIKKGKIDYDFLDYTGKKEKMHGISHHCENCSNEVDFYDELDDYFCTHCMMYGAEIEDFYNVTNK